MPSLTSLRKRLDLGCTLWVHNNSDQHYIHVYGLLRETDSLGRIHKDPTYGSRPVTFLRNHDMLRSFISEALGRPLLQERRRDSACPR